MEVLYVFFVFTYLFEDIPYYNIRGIQIYVGKYIVVVVKIKCYLTVSKNIYKFTNVYSSL